MIVVGLLLMQAVVVPNGAPDDIVVVGRRMERLKRLHMTTKLDRASHIVRCVFKRRSGDPVLDEAVCNAVLACIPKVKTVTEMQGCIAPVMNGLVANGVPWRADAAKGSR